MLHAIAQVSFVEHVERRALLLRQLHHIYATNEQVIVFHFGGFGQHRTQLHCGAIIRLFIQIRCRQRHFRFSSTISFCVSPRSRNNDHFPCVRSRAPYGFSQAPPNQQTRSVDASMHYVSAQFIISGSAAVFKAVKSRETKEALPIFMERPGEGAGRTLRQPAIERLSSESERSGNGSAAVAKIIRAPEIKTGEENMPPRRSLKTLNLNLSDYLQVPLCTKCWMAKASAASMASSALTFAAHKSVAYVQPSGSNIAAYPSP